MNNKYVIIIFSIIFIFIFKGNVYAKNNMYIKEIDSSNICEDKKSRNKYIGNQLIFSLNDGYNKNDLENIISKMNGEIVGEIPVTQEYQIEFKRNMSISELNNIINYFKNNDIISDISINWIIENKSNTSSEILIDNLETNKWSTELTHIDKAWKYKYLMKDINVGIIDSMFDIKHEDLKFQQVFNNPNNIVDSHGTHVAGILAAKHDNNIGIDGISPNCNLYSFSMNNGTSLKNKELEQLMLLKFGLAELLINGVKIINISMGNTDELQFALINNDINAVEFNNNVIIQLEKFLKKFIEKGYDLLIVQSAGNASLKSYVRDEKEPFKYRYSNSTDNKDDIKYTNWLDTKYNGMFSNITDKDIKDRIIVVGAVSKPINGENHMLISSQIGKRIDILAPGSFIYSCIPNNKYKRLSGTSMAAPFVAGTAAMVWGINPKLTGKEVKKIILEEANTSLKFNDIDYKILNAEKAVIKAIETQKN